VLLWFCVGFPRFVLEDAKEKVDASSFRVTFSERHFHLGNSLRGSYFLMLNAEKMTALDC
jgi:hypothetical protein